MSFDFPASPSAGQEFTPPGGPTYVWQSPRWLPKPGQAASLIVSDTAPSSPTAGSLWWESDTGALYIWYTDANSSQWVQVNLTPPGGLTAEARNRIVNGAMQISQQNGATAGDLPSYYPVDQWLLDYAGASDVYASRDGALQSVNGSPFRVKLNVTVADTSMAATDYLMLSTRIEGVRVADFMWGTASAKQVVVRFGFRGPAGSYGVAIVNGAGARSYVAMFTIPAGQANTDTTQTVVIPGDTTGTWLADTGIGMILNFALAGGTNFQGVAGWQAGSKYYTSAVSNGLGTVGNTFYLSDVGLYLDPLATGIAPPWQMPDEAQELIVCRRYWEQTPMTVTTAADFRSGYWKATKRVQPALSSYADAGSGATFAVLMIASSNNEGFYLSTAHSQIATALVTGNARM